MMFGETIRSAREKNRISQEDAAKAIEKKYNIRLSPSYLSMIESGTRTNLTVNVLNALLDFFNLPFETALSLFSRSLKNSVVHEQNADYQYASHNNDTNELENLPEEAKQSLAEYKQYILTKYRKA